MSSEAEVGAEHGRDSSTNTPISEPSAAEGSPVEGPPPAKAARIAAPTGASAAEGGAKEGSNTCVSIPSPIAASSALQFMRVVGKLKRLKRTGWVRSKVEDPESVADHMYRMAMCSFLVTDPSIDRTKLMKIAIVHDLAEALAGDITPHDGVSDKDKYQLEASSLEKIVKELKCPEVEREITTLWQEYEQGTSKEARVVKDFDKFEMIVQADEYEKAQPELDLSDFFSSTAGYFKSPEVTRWDKELRRQREERRAAET